MSMCVSRDVILDFEEGERLLQGDSYFFEDKMFIHRSIIICWATFLNTMERYKELRTTTRLYFNTYFMVCRNFLILEVHYK